MPKPLKFKPKNTQDFSKTLKSRVNAYFKSNNKSTYADAAMVLKTIIVLSMWIGFYLLIVLGNFSIGVNYVLWALLGVSITLVTINVGHDAIHGAYSKESWVNALLSHTFNLNGASAYMWRNMHNIAHHTYTNIHGYDEDISPVPAIRVSPSAELKPFHKYQHIYTFFLYSLATLSWIFSKDYVKFFKNEVGNFSNKKHPKSEYFFLFFYKFCCYSIFIGIPLIVLDQPWYHTIAGFVLMHLVAGFYLAIVFALAHEIEDVHFPMPEGNGTIENEWLIHQLYTTANFCTGSPVAAFLSGGLNQQVEHHLFPNICTIHYPALATIVQKTAEEFNLPYYNKPSFFSALKSHYKFLKKMGREKEHVPVSSVPRKLPEVQVA